MATSPPPGIEVKPWDLFNPGFTYTTKAAGTLIRFLEEPDSLYYVILYTTPFQMAVCLTGPNGNEVIWKGQREYHKGDHQTPREEAMEVTEALRRYPRKMDQKHRYRLAAQIAMFLGLGERVR